MSFADDDFGRLVEIIDRRAFTQKLGMINKMYIFSDRQTGFFFQQGNNNIRSGSRKTGTSKNDQRTYLRIAKYSCNLPCDILNCREVDSTVRFGWGPHTNPGHLAVGQGIVSFGCSSEPTGLVTFFE